MAIKEKVLASAKTSFAKYGLKKEELSKLVDQIVANHGLTDESKDEDVSSAIATFEPMVGLMQSMFNRAVSETTKMFEGWVDPNKTDPKPSLVPPTENLTMEQVQKMIAESTANNQQAITDAIDAAIAPYKEREEKARLNTLFNANEKIKEIPEQFRSRYQLDKEENLANTVQQCVDDWTSLKQTMVASGQFVEAPKKTSPEDETNDFLKKMEDYADRNSNTN